MSRKRYSVAFLAGHGIGAEVMAQASPRRSRGRPDARLPLDDEHVAVRVGGVRPLREPVPAASRRAVASASDAVLVPADDERRARGAASPSSTCSAVIVRVRVDARTQVTLDRAAGRGARAAGRSSGPSRSRTQSRARVTLGRRRRRRAPPRGRGRARGGRDPVRAHGARRRRSPARRVAARTLDVVALPARGRRHGRRGRRLHVDDPRRGVGPGRPAAARACSGRRTAPPTTSPARASPTRARCCWPPRSCSARGSASAPPRRRSPAARRSGRRSRAASRRAEFGDRVLAELPHGLRFEFGGAVA